MAMAHPDLDLECGFCSSSSANAPEEEEEGSDSDGGSCKSQFYSMADGDCSYDDCSLASGAEILEDEDVESVDLESGKNALEMKRLERNCRICHLSLVTSSPDCSASSGAAIELGCSCKDDLAAAHKQCAETWFKIRGNKTCEICNAVARNVVCPNDVEVVQQQQQQQHQGESGGGGGGGGSVAAVSAAVATAETASCLSVLEKVVDSRGTAIDSMNTRNAPPPANNTLSAPEREQLIGMMEKEMEYRVDMFNKLTHTCFSKCVEKNYKDTELNMGENSCIDRCVSKYWQVTNLVGQLLGNGRPPM